MIQQTSLFEFKDENARFGIKDEWINTLINIDAKDDIIQGKQYYKNQKFNTKQHIIDIIEADEKDGLYNQTINTMELQQIFETTKEQRVEFTHQLIERLNAGELDPLKTHIQVKALEDMLETLKTNKDYKDAVLQAAVLNGKDFEYMSAKFNIREVGVKYDYTKCESPAYEEIITEYNSAAKAKKDMEEFLKKVPHQGLDIINGVTGEVTKVYPPAKSSTTNVAVSLK